MKQNINIEIISRSISAKDLLEQLKTYCTPSHNQIHFEFKLQRFALRQVDPAILVATVGVAGTALGSLLAGLFSILKQKKSNKIVIRDKDFSIEISEDLLLDNNRQDQLIKLIDKITKMNHPQIHL